MLGGKAVISKVFQIHKSFFIHFHEKIGFLFENFRKLIKKIA